MNDIMSQYTEIALSYQSLPLVVLHELHSVLLYEIEQRIRGFEGDSSVGGGGEVKTPLSPVKSPVKSATSDTIAGKPKLSIVGSNV